MIYLQDELDAWLDEAEESMREKESTIAGTHHI